MVGKGVSLRGVDGTRPRGMPGVGHVMSSHPRLSEAGLLGAVIGSSTHPPTHPSYLQQTSTTMSPMHRSNQQASRRTPSLPSSSSSQGSNAWVNSFSQGGVGSTGSNYMTPRGEYISRPPCSRVTFQTGTSYLNTDKVTKGFILWIDRG